MPSLTSVSPAFVRQLQRQARHVPGLVVGVFLLLAATSLASLIWTLVPVPQDARWQPAPVELPGGPARARAGSEIDTILKAELFGVALAPEAEETASGGAIGDAPDTRLNLDLLGILASDDGPYSRALIGKPGGEEEPYSVGDDISSGVSLRAIYPDRVILARGGSLETLRLDKNRASTAQVSTPAKRPLGDEDATEVPADTAQMLADIRAEVLQNPAKASEYLRVQPAMVDGQMRGYRLYPGRERAVFGNAGLRPGDLVTAVNGVELNDPARALQLLGDLSQADSLSLVVERGGQQQTINLTLN